MLTKLEANLPVQNVNELEFVYLKWKWYQLHIVIWPWDIMQVVKKVFPDGAVNHLKKNGGNVKLVSDYAAYHLNLNS